MLREKRGQALVEWLFLGSAILLLWICFFSAAQKLLNRTVSETWGMFSARKALSELPIAYLQGMRLTTFSKTSIAKSKTNFENFKTTSIIKIPQPNSLKTQDSWLWDLLSFGSHSLVSLE